MSDDVCAGAREVALVSMEAVSDSMALKDDPQQCILLCRRIAHELRTPLGVLSGSLSQLVNVEADNSAGTHMLEMSRRAASQIERLADRLSLLARAEQGFRAEPRPPAVDLTAAARDAIAAIQRCRRRRGVTVELEPGTATTEGDPALITAAIAELVDNAVRFADQRVRVRVASRDGRAIVFVEDDGRGVDDEARERIGRRFEDEATRGGLGIGTSLAAGIADIYGGELRLEHPHGPTTFALALPGVRT